MSSTRSEVSLASWSLEAFHDLAFEHLASRARWPAGSGVPWRAQLARDLRDPEAQIGTGDDLAVHDRHDPIHFHRSVGGRRLSWRTGMQPAGRK
jgi:hypothetical protein